MASIQDSPWDRVPVLSASALPFPVPPPNWHTFPCLRAGDGPSLGDNPLFGSIHVPSPGSVAGLNPAWSPSSSAHPCTRGPPSSAVGLRRLGDAVPAQAPFSARAGPGMAPTPDATQGLVPTAHADPLPPEPHPEVADFARVLLEVMQGGVDAGEALTLYAGICEERARQLTELAGSQLARARKRGALLRAASDLAGEAATWRLLWHLHGVAEPDFPAGTGGGFVPGAGQAKTARQRAADLVALDPELNRAARAVAWLEGLAAAALDGEGPPAVGSGDGVWRETRRRIESGRLGITSVDGELENGGRWGKGGSGRRGTGRGPGMQRRGPTTQHPCRRHLDQDPVRGCTLRKSRTLAFRSDAQPCKPHAILQPPQPQRPRPSPSWTRTLPRARPAGGWTPTMRRTRSG